MDDGGTFAKPKNGSSYILAAIDHFTKWIAKAVPDTTAQHTVQFLKRNLVSRQGTPKRVLT
ncbi:hypothetical protein HPB50_013101 [Hyalomma asiaticum]|uniref:Uncharacterized protein n=1 Tax=Hyalomma asiaticum TaxID=266040 RepID=A0ACB7RX59_HYAAI|nr:hypothetical protein HPB50_013101 [Hyalomma asiaticum]